MKTLHIYVANKIATYEKADGAIVCGNSDYQVEFAFDEEWAAHVTKKARFVYGGIYKDVEFTGNICPVPVIVRATEVSVGVYVDGENMATTTGAKIPCVLSILCKGANATNGKVYVNGDSVFVRYSAHADGTDFTEEHIEGQRYIGVATGQSAPTDKTGYTWSEYCAKGNFNIVGTYEEECVLGDGGVKFLGREYDWHGQYNNQSGGRWFLIGAEDINFTNSPAYGQLLDLIYESTFITLHFKGADASFASSDTDFKEVFGAVMPLRILEDVQIDREDAVVEVVKERLPYVTNTCFVELFTMHGSYLLVYLSDFVTSSMAYVHNDGTACSLVFTGYSNT